jgi:hypothetical protein
MEAGANVDYSEKRTISSLMQNERMIPQESSPLEKYCNSTAI